jgi:hypothetical protein
MRFRTTFFRTTLFCIAQALADAAAVLCGMSAPDANLVFAKIRHTIRLEFVWPPRIAARLKFRLEYTFESLLPPASVLRQRTAPLLI